MRAAADAEIAVAAAMAKAINKPIILSARRPKPRPRVRYRAERILLLLQAAP